jgi:spore coat protein U-like protein
MSLIATLLALLATGAQAADNGSVVVSAVVPSKSNCKLNAGAITLAFGTIDPASLVDAVATGSTGFVCHGSAPMATFAISADDGDFRSGPGIRRLRHTTVFGEFLRYSISLSTESGTVAKGLAQTLTITGNIRPIEFRDVLAGAYQDIVRITLVP